ncbi:nuclear transport factor 2 family protein [Janthinobacterium sp. GW460P]|uniref:nuclear transport factor 2 family protein n=1 Tax=unclassified Janthinobacterium TaxID=2610881 RepID=UPI000A327924|nr:MULTISPECIES: nuclear transport factor 2 family protein [unclassified Janthinobacterium]MCC7703904.1 nuclear transport factor 2 family protein [Janthinobacterium sp. GW460P]MCC7709411.1 nuclear transport factor 2 family protein [Janthinobacterium sp. GW460W]
MKLTFPHVLSTCLLGAYCVIASANAAPADAELLALVQRHAQAQSSFDQATLKAVTAENYVEISPVGEVDGREKMLSFYAPEQKRPSPQVQVDEPAVRLFGDTALISARLSYRLNQEGAARTFAMRAGYVARLVDQQWLLVSAQYTGIRPPKP